MIDQRVLAVYAMCAIVITLYAIKEKHTGWLADLLGLALAFQAPRQSYAIGMVIILAIIRHTPVAYGLADYIPEWLLPLILPSARYVSISEDEAASLEGAYKDRVLETDRDDGNTEIPQPVAEKDDAKFIAGKVDIAATAVLSGAMGLTEATRIASGVQNGRKYSVWSRRIKNEIARRERRYMDLNEDKQQIPTKKP